MRAVILAAGFGNRMMPLTSDTHKTLLRAGGIHVLRRIIDSLVQCNVVDILIVTGYRSEQLQDFALSEYPGMNFTWVHNEQFDTTNNIFSLALAFEKIGSEDIVIIESDLVFEPTVIKQLLANPHSDIAMVAPFQLGMDGTVVTVENGLVTQFIPPHLQSDRFDFSDKYKTLNIYKFSAEFCEKVFRPIISFYAKNIDSDCYYESMLGIIIYMGRAQVHAEIVDNVLWTEIDDPMDLQVAEFQFNPQARRSILEKSHGGYWKYRLVDFCYIRNMYFPTGSMLSDLRNHLNHLMFNYGSAQHVLDQKLAYFLNCEQERIVLLNGASQVYPVISTLYGSKRVLRAEPTFGEYSRIFPDARTYPDQVGCSVESIAASIGDAEVVCIVNPNNPSGSLLPTEGIMDLIHSNPQAFFIVDESFIDFSDELPVHTRLIGNELDNVIVIKSLSKVFGVPGIRLGYAYSPNVELMGKIRGALPIWNMNSLAEYFLELLFKRRPDLKASLEKTKDDRQELSELLHSLQGVLEVYPSGGNFLLVRLDPEVYPSPDIVNELLTRDSIYVKDLSERYDGTDTFIRLAVRSPDEHRMLVRALSLLAR